MSLDKPLLKVISTCSISQQEVKPLFLEIHPTALTNLWYTWFCTQRFIYAVDMHVYVNFTSFHRLNARNVRSGVKQLSRSLIPRHVSGDSGRWECVF